MLDFWSSFVRELVFSLYVRFIWFMCIVLAIVTPEVLSHIDSMFMDNRGMKPTDREKRLYDKFMKRD